VSVSCAHYITCVCVFDRIAVFIILVSVRIAMSQEADDERQYNPASVPVAVGNARDLVACRECGLVKSDVQVCVD
jgi:hypothetical protein